MIKLFVTIILLVSCGKPKEQEKPKRYSCPKINAAFLMYNKDSKCGVWSEKKDKSYNLFFVCQTIKWYPTHTNVSTESIFKDNLDPCVLIVLQRYEYIYHIPVCTSSGLPIFEQLGQTKHKLICDFESH